MEALPINILKPYVERETIHVETVGVTVVDESAMNEQGEIPLIPLKAEEGPQDVHLDEKQSSNEKKKLLALAEQHKRILTDLPLHTALMECELTLLNSDPVFVK